MNNKSHRSFLAAALALTAVLTAGTASAQRALRIDSGDPWTNFLDIDDATAASITTGLGVDFLGAGLSQLAINRNGTVTLPGGVVISPFTDPGYDPNQMTIGYSITTAEGLASAPLPAGITTGFRVNWEYGEATFDNQGTLVAPPPNTFQLSLYELLVGTQSQLAMEFNFQSILFGGPSSFSGYDNGANDLDLFATLGGLVGAPYGFNEASGVNIDFSVSSGDFPFTILCPLPNANALACNNYYAGQFGPGDAILPTGFNDYFRVDQSFRDPVVGRYLFVFDAERTPPTTPVPEPDSLLLVLAGGLAVLLARLRRRSSVN